MPEGARRFTTPLAGAQQPTSTVDELPDLLERHRFIFAASMGYSTADRYIERAFCAGSDRA
jgi:hypothetical protein